ncbi:MAG TPA: protein-tyrosine-phosphatase [Ohtaekwangia sp.]|nr:protein-tyrosine-phosphatase [Ohtaekwangia sp.]
MSTPAETRVVFYKPLAETIQTLINDFDGISEGRKTILKQLSAFVEAKARKNEKTELIFICTHNSRRSHISQLWGQAAAAYYGIPNLLSYSGGTEATAFNPRAVKAMQEAGFKIAISAEGINPLYEVSFSDEAKTVIAFSKKYDSPSNPKKGFAAIMTCSHADENCPVVLGMEKRISLPYDDPKDFDGTPLESEKYAERVREIGTEILYAFSQVRH